MTFLQVQKLCRQWATSPGIVKGIVQAWWFDKGSFLETACLSPYELHLVMRARVAGEAW